MAAYDMHSKKVLRVGIAKLTIQKIEGPDDRGMMSFMDIRTPHWEGSFQAFQAEEDSAEGLSQRQVQEICDVAVMHDCD